MQKRFNQWNAFICLSPGLLWEQRHLFFLLFPENVWFWIIWCKESQYRNFVLKNHQWNKAQYGAHELNSHNPRPMPATMGLISWCRYEIIWAHFVNWLGIIMGSLFMDFSPLVLKSSACMSNGLNLEKKGAGPFPKIYIFQEKNEYSFLVVSYNQKLESTSTPTYVPVIVVLYDYSFKIKIIILSLQLSNIKK